MMTLWTLVSFFGMYLGGYVTALHKISAVKSDLTWLRVQHENDIYNLKTDIKWTTRWMLADGKVLNQQGNEIEKLRFDLDLLLPRAAHELCEEEQPAPPEPPMPAPWQTK